MKFGLLLECDEDFSASIARAALAEELGYDSIFLAEHHNAETYVPQPLVALAAIAARTERIRLGTFVVILPLYHPVVVAEQAAIVQSISRGRLICGVGLGYLPEEFAAMGVPFRERAGRMEEALEVLPRLWREEGVAHEGRHFSFSHATVHPRLDGVGSPPLWVGGWVEAAIRRAARLADAWVPGPTVALDTLRRCYAVFHDELARIGRLAGDEVAAGRELFCARSRDEARRVGGQSTYQFYRDTYLSWPHPYLTDAERHMNAEELARDRFLIGDPDDCAREVGRLQELGINHLQFRMQPPGVTPERAMESLRLFATEVAPRFR
jgi:probable F420-dependent oxidoreductase